MLHQNKLTNDTDIAAKHLASGGLLAFATETVYGLGADATNEIAIAKVFACKGRPSNHPLIVHIYTTDQLYEWARDVPPTADILAEHFWPGPLTLILAKHPNASPLITGGQETIGIRIPNHSLTLAMLKKFNGAIVGPSANKYGRISPTTAQHVAQDLNDCEVMILDGGCANVGIESTIIDLTTNIPTIRRQGIISSNQIADILQQEVLVATSANNHIRVPGNLNSHYAPNTTSLLIHNSNIYAQVKNLLNSSLKLSVLSFQPDPNLLNTFWLQASNCAYTYARDLYTNLRTLDHQGNDLIIIESPPAENCWAAIIDRLSRATTDYNSFASRATK